MKICAILEDTRNMLYAVWPHGCFAKLAAVPPTARSMLSPIPPQGGSVVVPPQGGPQASSSSSSPATYAQVIARNAPPLPSAAVGWNSQPALWPPLASRPTATKASRPAPPAKEPPAFRVKAQSQADRRQERQQVGKAAAADRDWSIRRRSEQPVCRHDGRLCLCATSADGCASADSTAGWVDKPARQGSTAAHRRTAVAADAAWRYRAIFAATTPWSAKRPRAYAAAAPSAAADGPCARC